ncbi:MAG: S-adenosylmethionine decarboxylase [bacterium]
MEFKNWYNLAPKLPRQRIMIEGLTDRLYTEDDIKDFMSKLTKLVGMRPLGQALAYIAGNMGYGGWQHWVTSGVHVYTYPAVTTGSGSVTGKADQCLVSVDAYTCKPFDNEKAVAFTKEYFNCTEIVWQEVRV